MEIIKSEDMTKFVVFQTKKGYHLTIRKDGSRIRVLINLPWGYWEFG